MKNLRKLGATVVLSCTLGASTFAGETNTPPCDPGQISTPPCAMVEAPDPGEMPTPPGQVETLAVSDQEYVTEIAASFLLTIVSLF